MNINSTSKNTYDFIVFKKNECNRNNQIYKKAKFEFIREQDDVIVDVNNDDIDISSIFDDSDDDDEDNDMLSINKALKYDKVYVDSLLKEQLDKFNKNTLDTLSYLSIVNKIKSGENISNQDLVEYNNLVNARNIDVKKINEYNEKDEIFLGFNPEF
jgi:hypothetical protein